MMNIKMIWFYAALAISAGTGAGAMALASPSQSDIARAVGQAQMAALQNCAPTEADIKWKSGVVRNSKPKNYTLD